MSADFSQSIVEVEGSEIGTGFIVTEDLIVTCAHVVGGRDYRPWVVFQANRERRQTKVIEELWRPKEGDDVAILHFEGGLPEGVEPLKLGCSSATEGHACKAIGYPDLKAVQGVLGEGSILGTRPKEEGGA